MTGAGAPRRSITSFAFRQKAKGKASLENARSFRHELTYKLANERADSGSRKTETQIAPKLFSTASSTRQGCAREPRPRLPLQVQ